MHPALKHLHGVGFLGQVLSFGSRGGAHNHPDKNAKEALGLLQANIPKQSSPEVVWSCENRIILRRCDGGCWWWTEATEARKTDCRLTNGLHQPGCGLQLNSQESVGSCHRSAGGQLCVLTWNTNTAGAARVASGRGRGSHQHSHLALRPGALPSAMDACHSSARDGSAADEICTPVAFAFPTLGTACQGCT